MDTGLRKRFINSNEEEKMMAHIYIAFVDTPGFFAALIRKFLKQRYVHVVIAADAMLTEAYSVGRRAPAIPFFSGFEREDKTRFFILFQQRFTESVNYPVLHSKNKKLWNDYIQIGEKDSISTMR